MRVQKLCKLSPVDANSWMITFILEGVTCGWLRRCRTETAEPCQAERRYSGSSNGGDAMLRAGAPPAAHNADVACCHLNSTAP